MGKFKDEIEKSIGWAPGCGTYNGIDWYAIRYHRTEIRTLDLARYGSKYLWVHTTHSNLFYFAPLSNLIPFIFPVQSIVIIGSRGIHIIFTYVSQLVFNFGFTQFETGLKSVKIWGNGKLAQCKLKANECESLLNWFWTFIFAENQNWLP